MKTVKITLKEVEWHAGERPDKDGTYWAVSRWLCLTDWSFTTEGGWNTHRERGLLRDENATPDDWVIAWTDANPLNVEVSDV